MSDKDIIKEAVREALEAHEKTRQQHPPPSSCPLSADDVAFLRRFKRATYKLATGVGMAVILGIVATVGWVLKLGIEAWRSGAVLPGGR